MDIGVSMGEGSTRYLNEKYDLHACPCFACLDPPLANHLVFYLAVHLEIHQAHPMLTSMSLCLVNSCQYHLLSQVKTAFSAHRIEPGFAGYITF